MKNQSKKMLSRSDQILLCLYKVTKGKKRKVKYEDLVVKLFKMYPDDFHMRGYPEYPDSSDSIQRCLYNEKQKGRVVVFNKIFSLTGAGLDHVKTIKSNGVDSNSSRYSRSVEMEVERIKHLEGFGLFVNGKEEEITEADLYRYFGVTVRSARSTFNGRKKTIDDTIKLLSKKTSDPLFSRIVAFHTWLLDTFPTTIHSMESAK